MISAVACKKESTPKPTCRVTELEIVSTPVTVNYTSENRVSSVTINTPDVGTVTHAFTYDGNLMTYNYSSRTENYSDVFTLNNDGTVKNMIDRYTLSGSPRYDVMEFAYNNNKQLKAVYHIINSSSSVQYYAKDTLIYSNGNLIKRVTYGKSTVAGSTYEPIEEINFTYGTVINQFGLYTTLSPFFAGSTYYSPYYKTINPFFTHIFGNGSTHLFTNATVTYTSGRPSASIEFTYTNPSENVLRMVAKVTEGGSVGYAYNSFTKSCN